MDKELELWDKYGKMQKETEVILGPHTSYEWKASRRRLIFSDSRYKFVMKMIGSMYEPNKKTVLDLGCNDGFGTYYVAEYAKEVLGVDFDQDAIHYAKENTTYENIEFKCENFLNHTYGKFDGVISFDVIEHIYPENEKKYMETVLKNLKLGGIYYWNPEFRISAILKRKCGGCAC